MELTTKGRYAVMAMVDIASHAQGHAEPSAVPLSQIAERQSLSLAYLEQIFVALRRSGLVESERGRSGGYRLARLSSEISIAEIMDAVDEETRFTRCSDSNAKCSHATPCQTHVLWQSLGEVTSNFFSDVSLAAVVSGTPLLQTTANTKARHSSAHASAKRVYLDFNATAPLRDCAKSAMIAALDITGNPSSVHSEGRIARGVIESARDSVARLVGAKPSEIVFVSGATEANAWVMAQSWDTIFVSGIEHDSILAPAKASRAEIVMVPVGADGRVNVEHIAGHVSTGPNVGRALVSLQVANNETGIVQDIAAMAEFARSHGLFLHTDAVQAAGRLPLDFHALGIDLMSVSAHKLGGPKGIGALVIRDHLDLTPLVRGGGQERRRRAGTENLAAIAGFGAAAEAALSDLQTVPRLAMYRDGLEAALREVALDTVIIGEDVQRLPNTTALALPGRLAETLVIKLDLAGVAISAGSACSSGKVGASHVLEAMGVSPEIAKGAIRVSLGPSTTANDIAAFIAAWKRIVSQPALAA